MLREKGVLWIVVGLFLTITGCALNQRSVVVRPEEIAAQNDSDWKITKQPQRGQQSGQR